MDRNLSSEPWFPVDADRGAQARVADPRFQCRQQVGIGLRCRLGFEHELKLAVRCRFGTVGRAIYGGTMRITHDGT